MGGSLFNSVLYPNMHSQIVQIKNMNECSKQRSNVFNMSASAEVLPERQSGLCVRAQREMKTAASL